jgi:hypothetical protein
VAKVILRFYGRFITAIEMSDGAPTGVIKLAAPRFDPNRFRPHKSMLSIATINVDARSTTIIPTMMTSAPQDPEGARAETAIWELTDCEVKLAGAGAPSATLGVSPHSPDFPLLDLNNLVQRSKTNAQSPAPVVLNLEALSIGEQTQALVHVTQGRGVVHRVLRPEITTGVTQRKLGDSGVLVTVKDATDAEGPDNDVPFGNLGESGETTEIGMGEVIEFELDLPTLTPFTFEVSGALTGTISMRAIVESQILTASFSTLCATLPTNENYDLEFEQYYHSALTAASNPRDRALVPKPTDDGGEPASCQMPVAIRFDRTTGTAVGS